MKPSLALVCVRIALAAAFSAGSGHTYAQSVPVGGTLDPLARQSPPAANGGATSLLMAVARAGDRLVAVGERGLVAYSDDNGTNWKQAKVPVSVLLTGVMFANQKTGWAVGHSGVVLKTSDGGGTWIKQLDGEAAARLVLEAVKSKTSSGNLDDKLKRQLADAERLAQDGADKPFLDLYVESDKVALVVGAYGLMFRTEDGGSSWRPWQDRLPNAKGSHLNAIRSAGSSLYVVGEQGAIYASQDRGASFVELKSPYAGSFFGTLMLNERTLTAFGLRGTVIWSDDAGATWHPGRSSIQASLNGGTLLKDGSLVLVSQAGNVLRSQDGGRTLVPLMVDSPAPFVGVTQAADGSLVLVGARGARRLSLTSATKP